jgi:hypothetical protein
MPLVRVPVGGSGAETLDTFDVAEMTCNQNAPRQWSSHQAAVGKPTAAAATTLRLAKTYKSTCIPTSAETDYLTSIDSSSGMKSEETDRFDNFTPLYDAMDNLDEMQHDPRNPFNKNPNTRRFGGVDYIPEEDEISLSTMDDSLNHSVQQLSLPYQNISRSNSLQQVHQCQNRSHRYRQRHSPSISSDLDDCSVSSYQSESTRKGRTSDNRSLSQLEAQVAKISFELATTKASLDELRLENRRLNIDKSALSNDIKVLKEQNEHLHIKIEKLEKEKILRSIEGTKSSARIDRESQSTWGGASVSGNTLTGDNGTSAASSHRELSDLVTGSLEIPFRVPDSNYRIRPKRSTSFASFDEFSYCGDFNNDSAHSIVFGDIDIHWDNLRGMDAVVDGAQEMTQAGRVSLLNMIRVGKRPSVGEMTNQIQEACILSQSDGKSTDTNEEALTSTGLLPSSEDDDHRNVVEDKDIGSYPQGNDCNDEDPFATWSAPGDRKRLEPELNWLQRGLGFGRERKTPQRHRQSDDVDISFDSRNDGKYNNGIIVPSSENEKYTSFADNISVTSDSSEHDKKGFGLFKGFGRRR